MKRKTEAVFFGAAAILIVVVVWVVSLNSGDAQRVRITNHSVIMDNVVLAIRNGYQLADDIYSINETEKGYDILIHVVKSDE